MTEIAKTVETKKEVTLVEPVTSVKPVTEKPKVKEVKVAAKVKVEQKGSIDDDCLDSGEAAPLAENIRVAYMRDPARDYPLKDLDINLLRPKLKRQSIPYYSRNNKKDDITYSQTFKHVIIRDTLYVIDNRSGITLTEQMWFDESTMPFSYLNDGLTNLPADIVILENSTMLSSYSSASGENTLRNSTLRSAYNIQLTKATVINGNARSANSMTITDCTVRNFSFVGDAIILNDLNVSEYYINVSGVIRITDIRWNGSSELRIYGDNIKDVEINNTGRIHNTGNRCRYEYYGDKPISIRSTRRVDNGYFMGSVPIPFVRTEDGVLCGGYVFTYTDFKQFIDTTLDKLSPPKPTDGNYQSFRPLPPLGFGYAGGLTTSLQVNVPGEILNTLYQLVRNKGDSLRYRETNQKAEKYTEVDSLLALTNEQISMLAGQISSRLRLFKELEAII